jgi:hypothetical protein
MNGKDTTVQQRRGRTAQGGGNGGGNGNGNSNTVTTDTTTTATTTYITTDTTTATTTHTLNDNKMDDVILAVSKVFFVDHRPLLVQMANDFYNEGIYQSTLTKLKGVFATTKVLSHSFRKLQSFLICLKLLRLVLLSCRDLKNDRRIA